MANISIGDLPELVTLSGAELVPILNGNTTQMAKASAFEEIFIPQHIIHSLTANNADNVFGVKTLSASGEIVANKFTGNSGTLTLDGLSASPFAGGHLLTVDPFNKIIGVKTNILSGSDIRPSANAHNNTIAMEVSGSIAIPRKTGGYMFLEQPGGSYRAGLSSSDSNNNLILYAGGQKEAVRVDQFCKTCFLNNGAIPFETSNTMAPRHFNVLTRTITHGGASIVNSQSVGLQIAAQKSNSSPATTAGILLSGWGDRASGIHMASDDNTEWFTGRGYNLIDGHSRGRGDFTIGYSSTNIVTAGNSSAASYANRLVSIEKNGNLHVVEGGIGTCNALSANNNNFIVCNNNNISDITVTGNDCGTSSEANLKFRCGDTLLSQIGIPITSNTVMNGTVSGDVAFKSTKNGRFVFGDNFCGGGRINACILSGGQGAFFRSLTARNTYDDASGYNPYPHPVFTAQVGVFEDNFSIVGNKCAWYQSGGLNTGVKGWRVKGPAMFSAGSGHGRQFDVLSIMNSASADDGSTPPDNCTHFKVGIPNDTDQMKVKTFVGGDGSLSGSLIVTETGKVGIGTSDPQRALSVQSKIGNAAQLQIKVSDSSSESKLEFGDNDDDDVGRIVYGHSNNFMSFFVNSATRMVIGNEGRVGINANGPNERLTVGGNLSASGFLKAHATCTGTISSIGSNDNYFAGNVGIGESAPRQKLTVDGDACFSSSLSAEQLTVTAGLPRLNLVTNVAGRKAEIYVDSGGVLKIQARDGSNNGIIDFQQSNGSALTVPMKISSLGNIGMGTLAPSEKLTVVGNISASNEFYSGGPDFHLYNAVRAGNPAVNHLGRALVHDENDVLTINYASDYEGGTKIQNHVSILSTGFVGIGEFNPEFKLTVQDDLMLSGASPIMVIDDNTADVNFSRTVMTNDNGSFRIQARAGREHDGTTSNMFISNDYLLNRTLSGAYMHEWRINNNVGTNRSTMQFTSGGLFIRNNSEEPVTPSTGGTFFVSAGELKYKGSSGTVTKIANA